MIEGGELRFESDIPQGYGLGSSGALTAAFYARFSERKLLQAPTADLQRELAVLESFFHGRSSGMDPLVSLLRKAIWRKPDGSIELLPSDAELPPRFSLIDSGQKRRTAPLVQLFMEKCQDPAYARAVEEEYLPATEEAIEAVLQQKEENLAKAMENISLFQWKHMREMIPSSLHQDWKKGLENQDYKMKLCGAGGGGFFLKYQTYPH